MNILKFNLVCSLFLSLLFLTPAQAQEEAKTQTVKGIILDAGSQQPLIGVSVFVLGTDPMIGTSTDFDGEFTLENVPVGRQIIQAQYIGYNEYNSDNFVLNSAKVPFLEIEMTENSQTTEEIKVVANQDAFGVNKALNDLSVVSVRSFTPEETERVPGSLNDPGRMAATFPGVMANQDSENDITIRGNSAVGMLWRLEGMDIQTTSHFARPGTSGGGISALSTSVLGTSDFSTGAFASEYGNALSGVFDLRFRKGNRNDREWTIKAGVIGLDVAAEGPFKKGRSSYLFNYRYSTLGILGALGLHVVRDNVRNTFQDFSYNIYLPTKNNKHIFSTFALGGISRETWLVKDTANWENRLDYIDKVQNSDLAVMGMNYTWLIDESSFLKVVLGGSLNRIEANETDSSLVIENQAQRIKTGEFTTARMNLNLTYTRKLNDALRLKTGLLFTNMYYNLHKQNYIDSTAGLVTYLNRVKGFTQLVQGYVHLNYNVSEKLAFNAGIHGSLLTLNTTGSVEPRFSMFYKPHKRTKITAAYGLHAQMLPVGVYLLDINGQQPNMDLKFIQSHHAVLGFEQIVGKSVRVLAEFYYQHLFNVPVHPTASNFWFLNERDNYGDAAYISEGTGRNYGVDLSVEKTFSNNFFLLCTGSLKRSLFTTLNNQERRARTDNIWNTSIMGGYEIPFKDGGALELGAKVFLHGGLRYTPIDTDASLLSGGVVYDDTQAFDEGFGTYFRLDTRIAYRKSAKKFAYSIALEIQNTTNQKNLFETLYDRQSNSLQNRYHSGILPALFFKIDF